MRKYYSIFCPPYSITSGGIRVMHGLKSWLAIKGEVVMENVKFKDDFIAVYPEIVNGNPFNAQTVVRYILQKPGMMTSGGTPGPTVFDKTDKIFVFSKLYNTMGVDEDHLMFLPIINLNLFKDQKRRRSGKCLFIGKGNPNITVPGTFIVDRPFAEDQEKLADYLNTVEVMFGYDPVSAMYDIARLCGCRVVVLSSWWTKEEFADYELCQDFNGLSWGKDEGNKVDSGSFREHYIKLVKLMSQKIDFFINESQK